MAKQIVPKSQRKCTIKEQEITAAITVKTMPEYDPDAVITSLALTVPSWTSSIERTRASADFNKVTGTAQTKLLYQLQCLKHTIDTLIKEIINGGKIGE